MSQGTGVPAVDVIVIWSVAAVAVAGLAALAWRTFRGVRRIVDRMDDLVDDWHGVPERPGVPGRLGVMARLRQIEVRLTSVEHELQPNSGRSLRDAVDRVDARTRTLTADTDN
ncbi:hypothetical protein [Streptomyces adelaidensis]|uniref:hypothetical protein n=1 Tax=Streptomyces adelaidensis TaxID=2796465 RepID=UPI001904AA80|nr:hypothetical protein [Streptomyces adelaidensis]